MNQNILSDTKMSLYVVTRKFYKSIIGFSFITLLMTAVLSIAHLLFGDATQNPIILGTLDFSTWFTSIFIPIIAFSLFYSFITSPIYLLSHTVLTLKEGLKVYDGIIFKRERDILYDSIEQIEYDQTSLQKITGNSNLTIEHDGIKEEIINVLPKKRAIRMMKQIASKAKEAKKHEDLVFNLV